jgi:hypothetical protein
MMPMRKTLLAGAGALALAASAYQHLYPHDAMDQPTVNALMTLGILASSGAVSTPTPGYRNTYENLTALTTYPFTGCDFGPEHVDRVVAAAITTKSGSTRAVSSATIGGVAAALASATAPARVNYEIWYARVPAGLTGNVSVVMNGSCSACSISVFSCYPASAVPVDGVGITAFPGTATVLTDLAKTAGGFAIFATRSESTNTVVLTGTGPETITENLDALGLGGADRLGAMSFEVTANSTTDDYTATFSGSANCNAVGATWGPPPDGRPYLIGTSTQISSATNAISVTQSHTVPAGTDMLVVRVASIQGTALMSFASCTFGGVAMTKRLEQQTISDAQTIAVFTLANPNPSTANIVITGTASTGGFGFVADNFKDALGVGAIDLAVGDSTGTAAALSLTTTGPLSFVTGMIARRQNNDITWPSPFTETLELDQSDNEFTTSFATYATPGNAEVMTPNVTIGSGARWAAALVELLPTAPVPPSSGSHYQTSTYLTIASQTVATWPGMPLGIPAGNRYVVAALTWRFTGAITSATINGVAATVHTQVTSNNACSAIIGALVPTGETGDIVVNYSSGITRPTAHVYALYGLASSTPTDTVTATGVDPGGVIDVAAGGSLIAAATNEATTLGSIWTGVTERADFQVPGGEITSSGNLDYVGAVVNQAVSVNFTATTAVASLAAASFA